MQEASIKKCLLNIKKNKGFKMALFDCDAPRKSAVSLNELDLNIKDIYFVAFFYQGELHSRPIQLLDDAYHVYDSNYSKIIRTETGWKYIFKEQSNLFSDSEKQITFNNCQYGFDSMRTSFIGRTPDESKIRFIKFNLEAPYLSDFEKAFLNGELETFNSLKPSLVKWVDRFPLYGSTGGFLNLDKYFVKNNCDVLNKQFFKE